MINITINIRIIDNTTTVTDTVTIVEVLVPAFLWLVSMMLWTMLKEVLRVETLLDDFFSDLTLLYVDDVVWVNEDVWKKVVIDVLIEVISLGTTDDVVHSTRSSVLHVSIVWVNEVELQITIWEDELIICISQHVPFLLQILSKHCVRYGDGREQYIVIGDDIQLHSQLLAHIQDWSPLPPV